MAFEPELAAFNLIFQVVIGRSISMNSTRLTLYHGTSSLFLMEILATGLGAKNPNLDMGVLELAKAIYPSCETQFSSDDDWMSILHSFGRMVEQRKGAMNFQHGSTYLSSSKRTAIKYAVHNEYGSELLSHTLKFLGELLRRKDRIISDELREQFPRAFELVGIRCAPILIELTNVSPSALLDEHGNDPSFNVDRLIEFGNDSPINQLTNFRLRETIPLPDLQIWLVQVTNLAFPCPEYCLHQLAIPGVMPPF